MWEPRRLTNLLVPAACYRHSLHYRYYYSDFIALNTQFQTWTKDMSPFTDYSKTQVYNFSNTVHFLELGPRTEAIFLCQRNGNGRSKHSETNCKKVSVPDNATVRRTYTLRVSQTDGRAATPLPPRDTRKSLSASTKLQGGIQSTMKNYHATSH
jgi:hypothetical protein